MVVLQVGQSSFYSGNKPSTFSTNKDECSKPLFVLACFSLLLICIVLLIALSYNIKLVDYLLHMLIFILVVGGLDNVVGIPT
jgi:hypothetical protein